MLLNHEQGIGSGVLVILFKIDFELGLSFVVDGLVMMEYYFSKFGKVFYWLIKHAFMCINIYLQLTSVQACLL